MKLALRGLVPGISILARYRLAWLRGDVLAGITVAAYLVPQVMAYSTVAGLPPVSGLWAILPALALYPLLGTSRQLSLGPESTTALMTAAVVGPLAAGDPARYAALAAGLAIMVGLLCGVAWVGRLGFVADMLSKPILVGYMAGVAVMMVSGQLGKLTGVAVAGDSVVSQISSFVREAHRVHLGTVSLAGASLAFLFAVRWRFPKVPGPLLAVLLATVAVVAFRLEARGIAVVGRIPAGVPTPSLPSLADLRHLLLPAAGVLLVGYTDDVLTARAFADRNEEAIDANQELLALGAANVGAGLLHGFPISVSGSRTALADATGARTQLFSLVAMASVLLVLFLLGPLLAHFPTAVLGSIVVYAAVRLVDLPGFRRLASFRKSELLLALACCAGVLALGVLYGVLLAVGLSVGETLIRVARPHDAIQGIVPGLAGMHDVDDYPEARTVPGLLVYRYDSPLFFANAEDFHRRALAAVRAQRPRWFVLNAEANVEVDITALDAVEALRAELARQGIVFALARVKKDLEAQLDAFGLTEAVGRDHIFPTLPTAVAAYEDWSRTRGAPVAFTPRPLPGASGRGR